jgi:dienelactone hydrolase
LLGVTAASVRSAQADTMALWREFSRQSVADLGRALDALEAVPELDRKRVAYAGFSLGAILGALYCPTDPRLRAAALALGGAGIGSPDFDPAACIGDFAPRPLLFVNASRGAATPRRAGSRSTGTGTPTSSERPRRATFRRRGRSTRCSTSTARWGGPTRSSRG